MSMTPQVYIEQKNGEYKYIEKQFMKNTYTYEILPTDFFLGAIHDGKDVHISPMITNPAESIFFAIEAPIRKGKKLTAEAIDNHVDIAITFLRYYVGGVDISDDIRAALYEKYGRERLWEVELEKRLKEEKEWKEWEEKRMKEKA